MVKRIHCIVHLIQRLIQVPVGLVSGITDIFLIKLIEIRQIIFRSSDRR